MSRPALFSDLPLMRAREAAKGKWLLIDFTASWCGPCQHMDKTTWVDPKVSAWVRDNAVAIQLDVDTDEDAKAFGVRAMPTVVMMKGDAEVDRIVGARPADKLMQWVRGLEQGKTDLDRARQIDSSDVIARFQLAQTLMARGAHDEALGELVWLWENGIAASAAFVGVRNSFLVAALGELAQSAPLARDRVEALRAAAPRGSKDWLSMSRALRDVEGVLTWFDEVKGTRHDLGDEHVVVEALRATGRLADYGAIIREPVKVLEQKRNMLAGVPKEHTAALHDFLRAEVETMTAALRAANRAADADALQAAYLKPVG